ncbi:MAG: hypothetical protein A2Z14_08005 [Chloroflexi bacterium RBG_16_48_8]|nr:MAG: hypothetical protein A2Z14_08005 [Chloroflexi bacterium RBG_16_48_8]
MAEGGALGIVVLIVFIGLMLGFFFIGRRWPVSFRSLKGYEALAVELERAVESGERVHLSLGTGTVIGQESAPALAGLTILARLASSTAMSDKPVIASTSDGAMSILAQDTLASSYRKVGASTRYDYTSGRMIGPTPFSYAAAIPNLLDTEEVSVHLMSGSFGLEGALAADFGQRENAFVLAGTSDVQAQALLYATADYPLIGEEIFVGGAYLDMGQMHDASLRTQDVIRFVMIGLIMIGIFLKTIGVIH